MYADIFVIKLTLLILQLYFVSSFPVVEEHRTLFENCWVFACVFESGMQHFLERKG